MVTAIEGSLFITYAWYIYIYTHIWTHMNRICIEKLSLDGNLLMCDMLNLMLILQAYINIKWYVLNIQAVIYVFKQHTTHHATLHTYTLPPHTTLRYICLHTRYTLRRTHIRYTLRYAANTPHTILRYIHIRYTTHYATLHNYAYTHATRYDAHIYAIHCTTQQIHATPCTYLLNNTPYTPHATLRTYKLHNINTIHATRYATHIYPNLTPNQPDGWGFFFWLWCLGFWCGMMLGPYFFFIFFLFGFF